MAVPSLTADRLEQVLATLHEEYRSHMDVLVLDRAIKLAHDQAVHLRMENRPRLVEAAVREYLESLSGNMRP